MTRFANLKRLGFFTRLLDEATRPSGTGWPPRRSCMRRSVGFDSAWIAQHHFHEGEGGLPAPFRLSRSRRGQTSRIRLGTGIVTLPLERREGGGGCRRARPDVRRRLEVGVGPGGNLSAFTAFGLDSTERNELCCTQSRYRAQRACRAAACRRRYALSVKPALVRPGLAGDVFHRGGTRAGKAGDGLMLSRTQPRSKDAPRATLAEIQNPMIDAYLEALPPGREPRILASRTIFVADDREEAMRLAEIGLRRALPHFLAGGHLPPGDTVAEMITAFDTHIGTPDDVIASLQCRQHAGSCHRPCRFRSHSIDPPHPFILRSIELIADQGGAGARLGTSGKDVALAG